MEGIDVRCPGCGVTVKVSTERSGYTANCNNCGANIDVPLPGVEEGQDFGDFLLKRRIGKGGMGEVWLAEQKAMARLAALKVLPPSMAQDDDYRERFLREARIAGKLHHPNIATAFSAGMVNGLYFLASRYIEGVNLADLQKAGQDFEERDTLTKVIQIADALDYAWNEYNIIHRDIKPENIMIGDSGKPVLLDLGIAKEVARFVLPQGTYTRLYITGSPRSFIHYVNVRDEAGVVQQEHVELAQAIKAGFLELLFH